MQINMKGSVVLCVLMLVAYAGAKEVPQAKVADIPSQHGLDASKAPLNTAVVAGTTVTFTCWVDPASSTESHRIQWTEFAYNSNGQLISDNEYILPAHPQSARYSIVHTDPLQYDLVIQSVTYDDAGVYSCFDANAPTTEKQRAAAQLIVIAGAENCTSTFPESNNLLEDAYYTVECILDYSGNIAPFAYWQGPEPFGQAQSSTADRAWSGMSIYANRQFSRQGWWLTFNFTDNFLPVPADTAENIPDFSLEYDTPRVTVVWPPKSMTAVPTKDYYLVGDIITCDADAFPSAGFIWHNLRTNERLPGSQLTIPAHWEGFDQTCRCQAINDFNGAEHSNDLYIPCNVPAPTTTPTTTPSTTTTPPPAVSNCLDLTGRWESVGPTRAYMCIEVLGTNGNLHGVLRNDTDTFWVDLVGVTDLNNYDHASFTGIWPLNRAVSTFIGECSRCHGVEHLLINAVSRTKGGPPCATAGEINYSLQYDFLRNPDIHCPPITIPPE